MANGFELVRDLPFRLLNPYPPPHTFSNEDYGYTGLLCGECMNLFFRDTLTGKCEACSRGMPAWLAWMYAIVVMGLLAIPVHFSYAWAKRNGYIGGGGDGDKGLIDNCTTICFVSKSYLVSHAHDFHDHGLTRPRPKPPSKN